MWDMIEIERVMYGMGDSIFTAPYFMWEKRSRKSDLADWGSATGNLVIEQH